MPEQLSITIFGLPLLALTAGFVFVFALPIWIAARIVGASNPTIFRSVLALITGSVLALISIIGAGIWALLLVPMSFLMTFKLVLGTTMVEAFFLSIIAFLGAAFMVKVVGGGIISTTPGTVADPPAAHQSDA